MGYAIAVSDKWETVFETLVTGSVSVEVVQFAGKLDACLVTVIGTLVGIGVEPGENESGKDLLKRGMHLLHLKEKLLSIFSPAGFDEVSGKGA